MRRRESMTETATVAPMDAAAAITKTSTTMDLK